MASSEPFDPFHQQFTLLLSDSTPFNVSMSDLDEFILYNVQICINYASQLGASLVLLIVLLLLTKSEKRSSPIFLINCLSLSLNFVRNLLSCLYFTGPFSETYAYFGQDYSRVPRSAYAISIAAAVLTTLLLVCAEVSLLLQIRVVCVIMRESYRRAIYALSNLIALMAISFRLALCVENARHIITATALTDLNWLGSASNITTSISICWFCAVFVAKLAVALYERRKLGLSHFGPIQIIFIMGCQTLIIPAIFSILQYFTPFPAMSSNVLTLITIFLPLSSLWASAAPAHSSPPPPSRRHRGSFRHRFYSGSTSAGGPLVKCKALDGPLSPAMTDATRSSHLSMAAAQADMYEDLEKQDLVA